MKNLTDFINESLGIDKWFSCDGYFDFKEKFFKKIVIDGYATKEQAKKFQMDDPFYTDGGQFVDAETSKDIKGCHVMDDGTYIDVYNKLVQHFIERGLLKPNK